MKIILAHNFYQQAGGEDEVFFAEAALLREHGHHVVEYKVHNDAVKQMGRLSVIGATVYNKRSYRELLELVRHEQADVVHFHNTFPLISPAGYYAAHAGNAAVVQTLHNYRLLCPNALFFREGQPCEKCLGKAVPWPAVIHKCYRDSRIATSVVTAALSIHRAAGTWKTAVDAYITLTPFARQKFITGGLPPEKLLIKPNFVNPDPKPGAGDGNYAIFVGRLSHEKGLSTLLAAWKKLHQTLPLKIIGDGPLADSVREAVQTTPGIEWLGRKPLGEVYDAIGRATLLILPSETYETFGRVAAEAFAKGTPVIASNHGAVADIVEHGKTGFLFEVGNANDLANKVLEALADPKRLASMRRDARLEFEDKYTGSRNHDQLIDIYMSAIATFNAAKKSVAPTQPNIASNGEANQETGQLRHQKTRKLRTLRRPVPAGPNTPGNP